MQVAMEEEAHRLRKSAAVAQAWDDWAVSQAMQGSTPPKRQRTVGTQVDVEMLGAGTRRDGPTGSGEVRDQAGDEQVEPAALYGQADREDGEGNAAVMAEGEGVEQSNAHAHATTDVEMTASAATHQPVGPNGSALGAEGNGPEQDQQQVLLHAEQLGCSTEEVSECSESRGGAAEVAATQYLPDTGL